MEYIGLVPVVVGAIIALACAYRLVINPKHPTQILVALITGLAVSATPVLKEFSFDGSGFKLISTALQAAQASQVNTESILDVRQQLQKVTADINDTLAALDQKVALASAKPIDTGSSFLEFPKTSPWGGLQGSNWCKTVPSLCLNINASGDSVQVPKTTFDDFWKNRADVVANPDFSIPSAKLEQNSKKLDDLLKQFQTVPIQ